MTDLRTYELDVNQTPGVKHDSKDEIEFETGRRATAKDLSRKSAQDELLVLARQHMERNEGCSLSDALRVTMTGSPDLARRYLGDHA